MWERSQNVCFCQTNHKKTTWELYLNVCWLVSEGEQPRVQLLSLFFRAGGLSTTGRTWPAPPAGSKCTCMDLCSGWTRSWPRWALHTTPSPQCPNQRFLSWCVAAAAAGFLLALKFISVWAFLGYFQVLQTPECLQSHVALLFVQMFWFH